LFAQLAALLLSFCAGTAQMLLGAGEPDEADASVELVDAGEGEADAAAGPDDAALAGLDAELDPCAKIEEGIFRRKAWLAARRQEQFERGGAFNPRRGVFSAAAIFCEAHPDDPDCQLGGTAFVASSDEYDFSADAGVDDYETHVILMKRALKECRTRGRRVWP
jgi:hypothetical protein